MMIAFTLRDVNRQYDTNTLLSLLRRHCPFPIKLGEEGEEEETEYLLQAFYHINSVSFPHNFFNSAIVLVVVNSLVSRIVRR
jgi:hypothetical protein